MKQGETKLNSERLARKRHTAVWRKTKRPPVSKVRIDLHRDFQTAYISEKSWLSLFRVRFMDFSDKSNKRNELCNLRTPKSIFTDWKMYRESVRFETRICSVEALKAQRVHYLGRHIFHW